MTIFQPSSGRDASLVTIPEAPGDLMDPPPALDAEDTCHDISGSGLSSGYPRPPSLLICNADMINAHRLATVVDACVITDELRVPASGNDQSRCLMTGSFFPEAVGRDCFPPPALPSSSRD